MSKHLTKASTWAGKPEAKSDNKAGKTAHEKLVKGLSHPLRMECLTILATRVASPRELSELLKHDLSNVSYHVRVLDELGLIELVKEESVRGAVAHFYRAVERPWASGAEWDELPKDVQDALIAHSWDFLLKDVTTAVEKGTFDNRTDRHLSRTSLLLDSEGFSRISGLMDELLDAIFTEQAASAERMTESGEDPIHAVAGTALFTMPDPGRQRRSN